LSAGGSRTGAPELQGLRADPNGDAAGNGTAAAGNGTAAAGNGTATGVGPAASGPLSTLVAQLLAASPRDADSLSTAAGEAAEFVTAVADPLADDDLQLALYLCFELHYRSFPAVDPAWEWNPGLLALRAVLEESFFDALEAAVGPGEAVDPARVGDLLFRLEAGEGGVSLSRRLEVEADLEQFREFVVHRSLYQLKEADPHSWAIPRLSGPAKTALLEVQGDEYGDGRPERMHSVLFAKTMRALDLDDRENAYLDRIPGPTLATVNLMSALGLRRGRRGAIVGHLAMFEMTSALPNRRYGNALRRLGFDAEATDFYDEHVEADAVHENIAAYDLAGGLARQEPELAWDIVFGARALLFLEGRFARRLLTAWEGGETSLRRPL
jgi:Iron-containing redox enzyme